MYAILFGYIHYQVKSAEGKESGTAAQMKKRLEVGHAMNAMLIQTGIVQSSKVAATFSAVMCPV